MSQYGTVQTQITRQDPYIEAYRLGLLQDTQGLIRNQMFGQQVQNLRAQGMTDAQVAQALAVAGQGTEGEEGYLPPITAEDRLAQIQNISRDAMFAPPDYQVADLTRQQKTAMDIAEAGVGSYKPFLEKGLEDVTYGSEAQRAAIGDMTAASLLGTDLATTGIGGAADAAQRARASTQEAQQNLMAAGQYGQQAATAGMEGLQGASAQFDPSGIGTFMSPYQQEVIDRTVSDLERNFQRQQNQREQELAAQAVSAGAFGQTGFERAKAREFDPARERFERELGTTVASMRQQGFQDAATRAQQAFEQARGRQLQEASTRGQLGNIGAQTALSGAESAGRLGLSAEQLAQTGSLQSGQLGLGIGQLGQSGATGAAGIGGQLASTGIQTAGLGELEQSQRATDISNLMQTGGMQQAVDQSVLDAQRMSNMQRYQQPFQQMGFLSDIYAGIPTSQSVQTMSSGNNASPFMQAASLGIAGLSAYGGAKQAGIL